MSATNRSRVQGVGWAESKSVPKSGSKQIGDTKSPGFSAKVEYLENQPKPLIKPDDIVINTSGEHILSSFPSGISKISYYHDFIADDEANLIFDRLISEIDFEQNSDKYGPQPRLTAWYADLPYAYSGLTHKANEIWPPILIELKTKLEKFTKNSFNSVLCNLYRDNHDGVDFHSDDEKSLRKNPFIGSFSFGSARIFEMRKKPLPTEPVDFSCSQHIKLNLANGSLVIMEGSTQDDWQHRVPKEYHDRSARINLTFRTIFPE